MSVVDVSDLIRTLTLISIFAASVYYLWRFQYTKIRKEKLNITRSPFVRNRNSKGESLYSIGETARTYADLLELEYSENDRDDIQYISVKDFLTSLHVDGDVVNLRSLVVTLVANAGFDLILPILGYVPRISQNDVAPISPMIIEGMQILLRNIVSPLTLSAGAVTMQKTMQNMKGEKYNPVEDMQQDYNLGNVFNLEDDLKPLLDRFTKQLQASVVAPTTPVSETYLPGLIWGAPYLGFIMPIEQQALSKVFMVLLNRLASNMYWTCGEEYHRPAFSVVMEGGVIVTSVEHFISRFNDHPDYEIDVQIRTLLTSFSKTWSAVEGEQTYCVPLVVPLRTGLTAMDGKEIVVPLSHCGVVLTIRGFEFPVEVEWYQNVGTFTGWHTSIYRDWPWQIGTPRFHDFPREKQIDILKYATFMSLLANVASVESGLAIGGYGFLGVCLDSVALLQYAVKGSSSLFPLLQAGQGRMILLQLALRINKTLGMEIGGSPLDALTHALLELETDIDIPPKRVKPSCERMLATLPVKSVFKLVLVGRNQASDLIDYIDSLKKKQ